VNPDVIVPITVPFMLAWIAWTILTSVRRFKIAKLQAEVQTKLLDKVGSAQDLLAYAQTEAGREMLESLKVEQHSPHARILGALQTSIVMICLGAALLFLRGRVTGSEEGFLVFGTLSTMLGFGFGLSAIASYYLSKSFGLLNRDRA
jgi:hypothetical protein